MISLSDTLFSCTVLPEEYIPNKPNTWDTYGKLASSKTWLQHYLSWSENLCMFLYPMCVSFLTGIMRIVASNSLNVLYFNISNELRMSTYLVNRLHYFSIANIPHSACKTIQLYWIMIQTQIIGRQSLNTWQISYLLLIS
jgi:hypothetical protein